MTKTAACPRCGSELEPAEYATLKVRRCASCKGFWVRRHEFKLLTAAERSSSLAEWKRREIKARCKEVQRRASRLNCPVCGGTMLAFEIPRLGLHLDRCAEHGVWFDEGEIEHLGDHLPGGKEGESWDASDWLPDLLVESIFWLPDLFT